MERLSKLIDCRHHLGKSNSGQTHPPMEISAHQESHADQNRSDAPNRGNGAATPEIVEVRLMPVRDDHHPEDREAERQADQAYPS